MYSDQEKNENSAQIQLYVSDRIGQRYYNWTEGDLILITAPTGSGKSYFVLHDLLKFAAGHKKKILYLVNRKILKKQIEEEIGKKIDLEMYQNFQCQAREFIQVMTYQSIEEKLKHYVSQSPIPQNDPLDLSENYDYIVYDECHYFFADANFNTRTMVSYDYLRYFFNRKIQIFISATMMGMNRWLSERPRVNMPNDNGIVPLKMNGMRRKVYTVDKSYDYINIEPFVKMEEIFQAIQNSVNEDRAKWLIFVDNKEVGNNFRNRLTKEMIGEDGKSTPPLAKEDVVFIDADYSDDPEATEDVKMLAQENLINKRVVISTAVMDNGISFHDADLRNLVILADTEYEFIQMLGRKRKSPGKTTVYICTRDIDHFNRRLQNVERVLKFFTERANKYEILLPNINIIFQQFFRYIIYKKDILYDLLQFDSVYNILKQYCFWCDLGLVINVFAIDNLYNLKAFYSEMIQELKDDPLAFCKVQYKWLGLEFDESMEIELDARKQKKYAENISKVVEKNLCREMSKQDNYDLKWQIIDEIVYFCRRSDGLKNKLKDKVQRKPSKYDGLGEDEKLEKELDVWEKTFRKTDKNKLRPIQCDDFNFCMESARLPYQMKSINLNNEKGFVIKRTSEN